MSSLKTFFKMIQYEIIKLSRNKLLFIFLIVFPVVMSVTISSIKLETKNDGGGNSSGANGSKEVVATLFVDGELGEDSEIFNMLDEYYSSSSIAVVQSYSEGLDALRRGDVYFFIHLDATGEPANAVFYYDSATNAGNMLVAELTKKQLKETYKGLKNFLADFGITINDEYFNIIDFKPLQGNRIAYKQIMIPISSSFISVIIMFGLAYLMARDNETNVYKQIAYTPISTNKYLLSKAVPFLVMGTLQAIALLLIGKYVYGVAYQVNFFIILLNYILFIFANTSLGLVFSSLKNQTTATFTTMISILLPLIATSLAYVKSYPFFIQAVLYAFPLTPFIQMFSIMTFNGLVLVKYVAILAAQTVGYYTIAYFLARKKAGK
jgi:ABC-type multidrug transport system permease subunit